ncbi:hypothetical protein DH2020_026533 [Rehmannia glutinosa]|uniref:Glycerol-3-phosphate acyltransferase RAM2/GPAT1-8 HAD-like domain-containing protein n=1 Tax=Rehmannia glutinosa TaxID=99300 RepID=A0ABR0VWS4_REHGL
MALNAFSFRKLALLFSVLLSHIRIPTRNLDKNFFNGSAVEFQNFQFLGQRLDLEDQVLVVNVEKALLKSSSLFPYFLLVAFEAGSLIRALILFALYPFIALFKDFAFKVMVMVCFLGLKKARFLEGRAVLPKFLLEDVGMECFQVLRRGKKTVAVSNLPRVMVESFLTDYLNIDFVVASDLKVFCGYFVGLMEERRIIRLKPIFLAALAMFIWLPMGFILAIIRISIALTLPSKIVVPTMHFTGIQLRFGKDPLTAVTYGISRVSEIISLVKTVRLTRDRDQDSELMRELLRQGDLVVCPEGTTSREMYLLRFSPLFAEITDSVCPVAIDCGVSMFYGTTARGSKSLDPLFFFMNPRASYSVRFLDMVRGANENDADDNGKSKFKVANFVQNEIGNALGFTCTKLTRKDKYLILAGNEGTF